MVKTKYFLGEDEINDCIEGGGKFQSRKDGIPYCSKCFIIEENEDFPKTTKTAPGCPHFSDSLTLRVGERYHYYCSFDKK